MNKITKNKPNYMKLFINAHISKNRFYFNYLNIKDIPITFVLSARGNGKRYVIEELNKKYGKR